MPEKQVINTRTNTIVDPNGIEIFNEYVDEGINYPLVEQSFIASDTGSQLGTSYKEGELLLIWDQDLNQGIFFNATINSNGELIIWTDQSSDDADKYSINNNAELIYTT